MYIGIGCRSGPFQRFWLKQPKLVLWSTRDRRDRTRPRGSPLDSTRGESREESPLVSGRTWMLVRGRDLTISPPSGADSRDPKGAVDTDTFEHPGAQRYPHPLPPGIPGIGSRRGGYGQIQKGGIWSLVAAAGFGSRRWSERRPRDRSGGRSSDSFTVHAGAGSSTYFF